MANAWTGDFQAVLQVSGQVVNGLLATMHRNAGSESGTPTMLHRVVTRIGDDGPEQGVRGAVRAQVGAPTVELIDGSTDQFVVACWVRAHFIADAETAAFPEFIHGELRVTCRVSPLTMLADGDALNLIAVEVLSESATFTSEGSTTADTQITEQVQAFLSTKLQPTHLEVPDGMSLPLMISLAENASASAVALPLALSGELAGEIASLANGNDGENKILLEGHGLALAVSSEFIVSLLDPMKAALIGFQTTFQVPVEALGVHLATVSYTIRLQDAGVTWLPSGGVHLTVVGIAKADTTAAPDATFAVEQDVPLIFDSAGKTFAIGPLPDPIVNLDLGVIGDLPIVGSDVTEKAKKAAKNVVISERDKAVKQMAFPSFAPEAEGSPVRPLVDLLRALDAGANVSFTEAAFSEHGVLLRGSVSLSPPIGMCASFDELADGSGYTALETWLPGGRITKYRWAWFTIEYHEGLGGDPGEQTPVEHDEDHTDRFILVTGKPHAVSHGTGFPAGGIGPVSDPGTLVVIGEVLDHPFEPQIVDPKNAIPSNVLPFQGQVCLTVEGVRTDVSGNVETVTVEFLMRKPEGFCAYTAPQPGWLFPGLQLDIDFRDPHPCPWYRLIAPGRPPEEMNRQDWSTGEVFDTGGRSEDRGRPNVIVAMVDPQSLVSALALFGEAIGQAGRPDAGVLLSLVLPAGGSAAVDERTQTELASLKARLPAMMVMITEDHDTTWSQTFGMTAPVGGAVPMVMMNAGGSIALRSSRLPDASQLASALRDHLHTSSAARPRLLRLSIPVGERAPDFLFEAAPGQRLALRRLRGRSVLVAFIRPDSFPSMALLGRLRRLHERLRREATTVIGIVDGDDAESADRLRRESSLGFVLSADPQRRISRRYGVQVWPTTVGIGADGRIATIDMGADRGALIALARERGGRPSKAY